MQNHIYVFGCADVSLPVTGTKRHQAARHYVFSVSIHNRQMILRRQLRDLDTLCIYEGVIGMNQGLCPQLRALSNAGAISCGNRTSSTCALMPIACASEVSRANSGRLAALLATMSIDI